MTLQEQIEPFRGQYPPSMIEEFLDYWEEKNAKGKERWQLEKTWEVGRRLKRRQRQLAEWRYEKEQRLALKKVDEKPREVREWVEDPWETQLSRADPESNMFL